nr:DHH family phosphoesterase [uncultured Bacillus sp.]
MSSNKKSASINLPLYGLMGVTVVLLGILAMYKWPISVAGFILTAFLFFSILLRDDRQKEEMAEYIATLSYRVKKVGEEALLEMPIGIMLINDEFTVEWTNPYIASCLYEDSLIGKSLYEVDESIVSFIKKEEKTATLEINERYYRVLFKRNEKLLYFLDVTDQVEIEKLYEDEKTVFATIFLDNYDDVTQTMDDSTKSGLNNLVTSILNKWALENEFFIKRVSSDRYVGVLNERILRKLEKSKFTILDEVREATAKLHVSLTLSIGVGTGDLSLPELGELAQSSLDLSLGRGGDQATIKQPNGKVKFYGGKTNPVEKRTRVRARVISHALKELVMESDKVIIMGHKYPDMDAIGASIGILKITQLNKQKGYIVVDPHEIDKGVQRLMDEVKKNEALYSRFITPEAALDLATDDTLLVIVDTHKPSMLIEERLLSKSGNVVVIDHHRRGEEFIQHPILVYMEPYASSTSELVTELLEYQPKTGKIEMLEATALLAGIVVDTKSFTLRTGARTFDAASYLRAHGADTVLVQRFLKEDVDTYIKRAKLIEKVRFYQGGIAIAKGEHGEYFDQVLIAQTADTLLAMDKVSASFVISYRSDNMIGISARSLGEINVQIVMELLGGGGHLTNAATQLTGVTIEEAEEMLIAAIDNYFEGRQQE